MSDDSSSGGGSIVGLLAGIAGLYIALNFSQFTSWANGLDAPISGLATVLVWALAAYGVLWGIVMFVVALIMLLGVSVVIADRVTA